MTEGKRGCGYRKINGLYLVADPGSFFVCDGLPLPLIPCECCNYSPPFSRNFQWITQQYLQDISKSKHGIKFPCIAKNDVCSCHPKCPVCHSEDLPHTQYGLMYVSKQSYSPASFIKEAKLQGVSKRIPEIPKGLELGKTWVMLAHNKTPDQPLDISNGLVEKEPEYISAIFHAFIPQRVEMPVWKDSITSEEIQLLEEKGITPILIENTPENRAKHKEAKIGWDTKQRRLHNR